MKTKKLLAALLAAILLLCGLTGCYNPDTVGTIGDYEVTSGVYLICQLNAFTEAVDACEEEDATSRNILDYTVEGLPAREWIANKTEEYLRNYAYIELEFDNLGLSLSSWDEYYIEYSASESWNSTSSSYTKNGIGYDTFIAATTNSYKSGAIFDATYMAADAPELITDDEYIAAFEQYYIKIDTLRFPTMTIGGEDLSDEDKARVQEIAQTMADEINAGATPEEAYINNYGEVLEIQQSESLADAENFAGSYTTGVLTYEGDTNQSYSSDFIAAVQKADVYTASLYVDESGYCYLFYRYPVLDDGNEWEENKSTLATLLKEDEFNDAMDAGAAELDYNLNARAIKYYSVDKIKL